MKLLMYIPSYNRAPNLKLQIATLREFTDRQRPDSEDQLLVIVNDNCSPKADEYAEVRALCKDAGYTYVRNAFNVGANPNIVNGFLYLNQADYVWICSDDEL